MLFIIGFIIVFGSVLVGYGGHGGNMAILNQPFEVLIIFGAATGAFIISNPPAVLKGTLKALQLLPKPTPFARQHYLELLMFQFNIFRIVKTKGILEVEGAIEAPHESELFTQFPLFSKNHHAVVFFCDALRLLSMGVDDHYQMDDLLSDELERHHHSHEQISGALTTMADGMPALGIVAAVLGVITTMASITEPPEILGGLIGAALVGTFLGVLLSYGLVGPIAFNIAKRFDAEHQYMECIKAGILAHMQGNAPQVTVEFARKAVPPEFAPTFQEVEDAASALSQQEEKKSG